jgi:alkanesulfonate monooxygenase
MAATSPRFGIWAVVHGSRGAYQDPDEPYDASWERNRDLVLAAEQLGYDSTLITPSTRISRISTSSKPGAPRPRSQH